MKNTFILTFLIIGFCSFVSASPQIRGIIVEKGTGNPIESADVILLKKGETTATASTLSESNGSFQLSGVVNGEYSLIVRLIGYDVYTQGSINLRSTETVLDLGIIELQPLEIGLSEVVIESDKR
ncbi:MAG: carboxypeptidase-like regulatory domain-containing protein [Prevotella sp.]|jgi:hypothetical protein|nr:carboxypeptidase-like regulatory domain-containing protein [Prevotella sp.]